MTLFGSQLRDALTYVDALTAASKELSRPPDWGGGLRLTLPKVIPLTPDYEGEDPVAWLVESDMGWELTTTNPNEEKN